MTSVPGDRAGKSGIPGWLLPALVCGAAPSLLFLLASVVLVAMWLFRSEPGAPDAIAATPRQMANAATVTPSTETLEVAAGSERSRAGSAAAEATSSAAVAPASGPRRVRFLTMPRPDNVNLPMTIATDYVYDHHQGRLGILGPWQNAVGFISVDQQSSGGTIAEVTHVRLRGTPHALTYQDLPNGGGVFAIAQTQQTGITLLDAESLEIVKAVRLDTWPTFMWATGKAEPEYLYFTTQLDHAPSVLITDDAAYRLPAGWDVKMQRIDLVQMELDTRFDGEEFRTSRVTMAGGRFIRYFVDIVYVDPDRRFIAHKDSVYSNDDGRKLTDLSFQARGFLADGPWLTGVNGSEIVVGSINDGRIVAGISLPAFHEQLLGRIQETGHVFAKTFLDVKRNYLVAGRRQHVIIIPLETLNLPDEPVLLLDASPPTSAKQGELYEFPLRAVSGDPSFTLAEGPEGMTIQDGVLRWRPETPYTAPVEVKVTTTAGDTTREDTWQIVVE